ncbi:DUF2463 domain-containing protein [Encephalitozoon intestinalis]|nr:DUF2463 domain-containing protein [Encephalitozoon intestinalis]UTX45154.1 DUF2463 domain-containing protein [Encephalitozoon intestinalis]UTX45931.1 DUF2463 domain-containing protein [Encephalitozoon intestinalis]UTX46345.1 DUF2463 domain-containing protein [Encephalitozoon intestinalis]
MAFISIPEQTTIQDSDHQESSKLNFHRLLDLYPSFATPISILIPLLMNITLDKNTFKSNPLFRFIFFAIPLSHLSLLNLRLLFSIKNSDKKSLFSSILHSVFRFLFFTFSIISILLIPAFYLDNPEDFESLSFFFLFVPFPISATYLLSTSCCLTPGSISFIDTSPDALFDILPLLSSLVFIFLLQKNEKYLLPSLCLYIFSFLLILLRSYNQRYNPSPKAEETTLWRKIVFATIFAIFLFAYIIATLALLLLALEKLPIPPPRTQLNNKP